MKKILFIFLMCLTCFSLSGCLRDTEENNESNNNLDTSTDLGTDTKILENEVSSYSIQTSPRDFTPGEDIYVYDNKGNLVLSLNDENQPQYLFALYENFIILDSGTSASQREILVYNIESGDLTFQSDYYPGENGLILNDNEISFYKKIDDSLLGEYTLPSCENEYDNGYIENYGYTIGENQANDLGDIQCAYFE